MADQFNDYENMKDKGLFDSLEEVVSAENCRNRNSDFPVKKQMTVQERKAGKPKKKANLGPQESSNDSSMVDNQSHSMNMQLLYISSTYDQNPQKAKHRQRKQGQYAKKASKNR